MQISRRAFTLALPASALLLAKGGGESLKQVTPIYVCFVDKKYLNKPQDLITIEGKNYYACGAACTQHLKDDPKTRFDKDPLSGKEIDKATAAVGADKDGNVYFFENQTNLRKFRLVAKN